MNIPRGLILLLLAVLSACEAEEEEVLTALVDDPAAVIAVQIRQTGEAEAGSETEPVEIRSSSGVLVAYADASPRIVPVSWGERDADPTSDYMLVTVSVVDEFLDRITQVELSIAIGGEADPSWCEPMSLDGVAEGSFFLHLQPSCEQEDRLTGECILPSASTCPDYSGTCREDLLTFTLWDDISSVCHGP